MLRKDINNMKKMIRNMITAAIALSLMLAGCGSKEVVMKEFASKDQTETSQQTAKMARK